MIVVSEMWLYFPLNILLKAAHLSRSTYYYHLSKKVKDEKNRDLMQLITDIFHENNGQYGFHRVILELRERGTLVNKKKVYRLVKKLGLKGKRPKVKYHSYKGEMNGVVKNLLLDKVLDDDHHKTYYK